MRATASIVEQAAVPAKIGTAPVRLVGDDLGDPPTLVARQVRELARPARRHDPVHAAVDDVADDAAQRVLVDAVARRR